jgi:hypothetical protein
MERGTGSRGTSAIRSSTTFLSALTGGPCGKLYMWITPSSKKTIVSTSPENGVSSGEPPRHAKGTPSYVTPMILFRPWMDRIFIFFCTSFFPCLKWP